MTLKAVGALSLASWFSVLHFGSTLARGAGADDNMTTDIHPEVPAASAGASRIRVFLRGFGPGLLWAGTAIGVSHLVQSTRAGADAGFARGGVVLFALILKYPFF